MWIVDKVPQKAGGFSTPGCDEKRKVFLNNLFSRCKRIPSLANLPYLTFDKAYRGKLQVSSIMSLSHSCSCSYKVISDHIDILQWFITMINSLSFYANVGLFFSSSIFQIQPYLSIYQLSLSLSSLSFFLSEKSPLSTGFILLAISVTVSGDQELHHWATIQALVYLVGLGLVTSPYP